MAHADDDNDLASFAAFLVVLTIGSLEEGFSMSIESRVMSVSYIV